MKGALLLGAMLGIPFGLWQDNFFAGLFMFEVGMVIDVLYAMTKFDWRE